MACAEVINGNLFIKTNAQDTGNRELIPCNNWWNSPDIFITDGVDDATILEGVPTTISVRVNNKGNVTMEDINVFAWVSDYTMGVGPNSAIVSAGGATGMTAFLASLAAGQSTIVECTIGGAGTPWTPTDTDAHTNNGHLCIAATVTADNPAEGTTVPPGTISPCCDCHDGQRNIHVVNTANFQENRFTFELFTGNPFLDRPIRATVAVAATTQQAALGLAERRLLVQHGFIENADELPAIVVNGGKPGVAVPLKVIERATAAALRAPLYLNHGGKLGKDVPIRVVNRAPINATLRVEGFGTGKRLRGELDVGERRKSVVTVQMDPNLPPGSVQIIDMRMTDETGDIVGGARILAIVTQ